MTRLGKTWKDQLKRSDKAVKEPKRQERGGMRNLVRDAEEEMWEGAGDRLGEHLEWCDGCELCISKEKPLA